MAATLGGYELLQRLAVGGMAEVFLARKPGPEGFEKRVALKRILPHLAEQPDFVAMFLDEARLAATLDHPHIVHIHDFGVDRDSYFLAMEYVCGEDVQALWRRAGERGEALAPEDVATILIAACEALHHAHERGVVHRDVTPANLLVSYDGVVKLADFGIAKSQAMASRVATTAGTLKGKIPYMSPEQARAQALDRRSDLYSLGICAWELLTGQRLFQRDNDVTLLAAVQHGEVPGVSSRRPGLPAALAAAIDTALAPAADDRWQSAVDLGRALGAWLASVGAAPSQARLGETMARLFGSDAAARRTSATAPMDATAPGVTSAPTPLELMAAHTPAAYTPPGAHPSAATYAPVVYTPAGAPSTPLPSAPPFDAATPALADHPETSLALVPYDAATHTPLPAGELVRASSLSPQLGRMLGPAHKLVRWVPLHPERWIPQIAMHLHLPPPRTGRLRLLLPLVALALSAGGLLFGLHSPHARHALSAGVLPVAAVPHRPALPTVSPTTPPAAVAAERAQQREHERPRHRSAASGNTRRRPGS